MNLVAKIDEIFEMDEKESREQLIQILQSGKAYVCDESFLPENAKYKVVMSYSESQPERKIFSLARDQIVQLDQRMATKLLLAGYIMREHPEEWSPKDLKTGKPSMIGSAKKMFDDTPDSVNFVMTRGERREK